MHFLTRVERLLDIPSAEKNLVMRELKSHYFDLRDELVASGMSAAEAASEAEKRLGSPEDVAARFAPVHNSASWRSAILAALPFLVWGMSSLIWSKTSHNMAEAISWLFGAVMIIGSIRELCAGRRPIWLATWLAWAFSYFWLPIYTLLRTSNMEDNMIWVTAGDSLRVVTIAIIMLAALWKAPKWRTAGIALCIVILLCALDMITPTPKYQPLPNSVMWIANTILAVAFALRVFMLNDYGNAAYATLFLLAWNTKSFHIIPQRLSPELLIVCYTLLLATIVVLFARMSDWKLKITTVFAGLTTCYGLRIIMNAGRNQLGWHNIITFIVIVELVALLVCLPIILERLKRRRDRIEIAQ